MIKGYQDYGPVVTAIPFGFSRGGARESPRTRRRHVRQNKIIIIIIDQVSLIEWLRSDVGGCFVQQKGARSDFFFLKWLRPLSEVIFLFFSFPREMCTT